MFRPLRCRLYGIALSLTAAILVVVASTACRPDAPVASANGLAWPIAGGTAGPYEYLVGIWPPTPRVGNLHMVISLSADGQVVTDLEVDVTGRSVDGSAVAGPVPAANIVRTYELNLPLSRPGPWVFAIAIKGPLGEGVAEVPLDVEGDLESLGDSDLEEGSSSPKPDDQMRGGEGAFSWAFVAAPLAVLGLVLAGLGFWRYRRRVGRRRG